MSRLELKFDPNTIEHLGVKMYSTLPPALAEWISNAYDADASEVVVEFLEQNGTPKAITVYDDGIGMTAKDIQEKFNRAESSKVRWRPTFSQVRQAADGQEGAKKTALFGLAKQIVVDTKKDGL